MIYLNIRVIVKCQYKIIFESNKQLHSNSNNNVK
jgi:hypothetical protein